VIAKTERDGSITATMGCGNDDRGKFLPEFADVGVTRDREVTFLAIQDFRKSDASDEGGIRG
jgi:hypothetical protein